jgi:hypothetical protein
MPHGNAQVRMLLGKAERVAREPVGRQRKGSHTTVWRKMRQLRGNHSCIIKKLREGQERRKGLSKESHAKECDYFHATRSAAVVKIRAGFVLMESAAHVGTGGVPSA